MLIQLLDYLQNGKTYSIQDLADLLHKDIDSVRVELEYLENQGYIRKANQSTKLYSKLQRVSRLRSTCYNR